MSLQMFRSGIVQNRNGSLLIYVFVVTLSGAQVFGEAGDLDPTFGGDGQITTDFGGVYDSVSDVAIRNDGHIVAVGTASSSNPFGGAVYDANGALDLGFDGDGKMILDQTGGDGAVLWTETDQILVSTTRLGGSFGFVVARLNGDGTYDTSFGSGGKRSISMGSQPHVEAMCVQPDGKIVVAGYSYFSSNWSWALARFTSTGSIDTSFNDDGIVTTDFSPSGGGYDHAHALAIQPDDGKIVVGGTSEISQTSGLFSAVSAAPATRPIRVVLTDARGGAT